MPIARSAFCIFCDDIRQEVGNKFSFMGVYSGDMTFPVIPPAQLSKFCIAAWLISPVGDAPQSIAISIFTPPGKTEFVRIAPEGPPPSHPTTEGMQRLITQFLVPITGLPISEDGFIEVEIETERETLRAGRIKVQFAPPPLPTTEGLTEPTPSDPTASPPPSELSPSAAPASES